VIAFKFLCRGAVSPFTGFRWPSPGEWVSAPAERIEVWIRACRVGDLPLWLDEELWRIEVGEPVRNERYQVASPTARLVARVTAWNPRLAGEYAKACALRVRDLALPHLAPALRDVLAAATDLAAIGSAVREAGPASRAAGFVADAVARAQAGAPAAASYIAAAFAASQGGDGPAFEAERAWQARWLAEGLELDPATRTAARRDP
jgi:hypothetical protein